MRSTIEEREDRIRNRHHPIQKLPENLRYFLIKYLPSDMLPLLNSLLTDKIVLPLPLQYQILDVIVKYLMTHPYQTEMLSNSDALANIDAHLANKERISNEEIIKAITNFDFNSSPFDHSGNPKYKLGSAEFTLMLINQIIEASNNR